MIRSHSCGSQKGHKPVPELLETFTNKFTNLVNYLRAACFNTGKV